MSWHPTEDDLVLHFYREDQDRAETIAGHLKSCTACRASFDDLREALRLVDSASVPEPDASFERVVWARVQAELPAREERRLGWSPWRWLPVAGLVAAMVTIGVVAGTWWRSAGRTGETTPAVASVPADQTTAAAHKSTPRERVLLSALDDHLEQAQTLLVELMNTSEPNAGSDFAFERSTAGDLVASGRLYRTTARQYGETRLAGMLDDLEAVLIDVARGPARPDRGDLQALRARIDDASLLFKVRAVTNEIREREKRSTNSE